jgi:YaiO family outer membrane protein
MSGFARLFSPCLLWTLILLAFASSHASAQSGPFIDASGDFSPVTIGGSDTTWHITRVTGGIQRDGAYGVNGTVERQQRGPLHDITIQAGAFLRGRGWTVGGSGGATQHPDFLYRHSVEGSLSRELGGGLVVTGGYRYLAFGSAIVHIAQPSVSWYFSRGDIEARGYSVRNHTTGHHTSTGLLRASIDVSPRVRISGGGASGSRIFDVAALARNEPGWVAFGNVRVGLNQHWFLTVGAGGAHEDPFFSQRTATVGLRHVF